SRIEIPQCSSLLPYRSVLSSRRSTGAISSETSRVHHACRRRRSRVAARGARAAIGDTGDRVHRHWVAGVRCLPVTLVLPGPERNRLQEATGAPSSFAV